MLSEENNGFYMPVAPAYGNGNGGFGGFGGDWGWIILLLLFAGGGWGNGFGGGYNNALGYDFPWLLNGQNAINANTNAGFDSFATQSAIGNLQGAVTSGFGDVQTALCGGFASVNAGIANGFAQAEISENARQMANMNQMFGVQTALQNCCCENRAATADLKYTVATEACADRAAISDALRTVIAESNSNTQKILDRMCQQEIDNLKAANIALQNQNNMLNLAASQTAQTAQLIADNTAQTQYIVNRVAPYPVPAYTVANPVTPA